MALTENLTIYRSMYRLLLKLMDARSKFDKTFKYVVGDRLICGALHCLALIHYANEDRCAGAREQHLSELLIKFDILKTLIMVCRDRNQFRNLALLGDIFQLAADVEKQATAWRRSTAGS